MEVKALALVGGCACGQVRYQINDDPLFTYACHCTDCQRTTGSAFVVHSTVAKVDFEIEGETQAARLPTGSGAGYDLHFCPKCGTFVWCIYHVRSDPVLIVRTGTLDDTAKLRPQAHIFTRSMQTWFTLPEDVPSFPEAFDRGVVWPTESLKKLNELTGSD